LGVFLLVIVPGVLSSQVRQVGRNAREPDITFPRLETTGRGTTFSHSGDYTWLELRDIAIWASSTSDIVAETLGQTRTDYGALVDDAVDALRVFLGDTPDSDERAKAEGVLTFIHENYLQRYNALQTRVDTLFDTGRFNCVSSAVLYVILAKAMNLDVAGVATKDHAFATVTINGEVIDVETTNAYGFDPGNRKDFHDGFGQVTGFAYVSPKNYRDRAAIGTVELVSLILTNRTTELEKARRYSEAVPLAVDRSTLLTFRDPIPNSALFADPKTYLLDRLFNYGASLLNAGHNAACLRWADTAGPKFPDPKRWTDFTDMAVNNMVGKELQSLQRERVEAARLILDREGQRLSPGMTKRLTESVDTADQVVLHNLFAAQYNKRDFQAAFQTISAAVTKYPGSRQLASDLSRVQKALE
jgi:hypothetical protein